MQCGLGQRGEQVGGIAESDLRASGATAALAKCLSNGGPSERVAARGADVGQTEVRVAAVPRRCAAEAKLQNVMIEPEKKQTGGTKISTH